MHCTLSCVAFLLNSRSSSRAGETTARMPFSRTIYVRTFPENALKNDPKKKHDTNIYLAHFVFFLSVSVFVFAGDQHGLPGAGDAVLPL